MHCVGLCATDLSRGEAFAARLPLQGGGAQGVAAVVNDDLVSRKDVRERVRLLIAQLQLSDTPDVRKQLIQKAVHDLINEQLKSQVMEERGISVSDADVQAAKQQMEKQHGLAKGALDAMLQKHGLRKQVLERQVRVDVGWARYAHGVLRQQIVVDEREVDAFLDSRRESLKHPQRLLAEIVLPVLDPKEESKTRALAQQLFEQMRQGASFQILARQFSASATAAVGGDLGWVKKGSLPRAVENALKEMKPGTLSVPIRTANGYSLILLRDVRSPQRLASHKICLKVDQAFIPGAGEGAPDDDQRQTVIARLKSEARSCGDVARLATEELGSAPQSGEKSSDEKSYASRVREDVSLADFPASLRPSLQKASLREVLGPFDVEGGVLVALVCERQDVSGLPSYQEVERRLELQKLERVSRRALQDLRRRAVIDIRL